MLQQCLKSSAHTPNLHERFIEAAAAAAAAAAPTAAAAADNARNESLLSVCVCAVSSSFAAFMILVDEMRDDTRGLLLALLDIFGVCVCNFHVETKWRFGVRIRNTAAD